MTHNNCGAVLKSPAEVSLERKTLMLEEWRQAKLSEELDTLRADIKACQRFLTDFRTCYSDTDKALLGRKRGQLLHRESQALLERARWFLSICKEVAASRCPEEVIGHNHAVLARELPVVQAVLERLLEMSEDYKRDLSYRERALRAERELRRMKKENLGEPPCPTT